MDLAIFNDVLMSRAGFDPDAIGPAVIRAAVARRMLSCGCRDERAYLLKLQSDLREMEALILALTVPETWFFRERESFVWLKTYLETEWLPRRGGQALRILSLPCCTGEEPYSISMTLLDMGWRVDRFVIDALDINPDFLEKARGLEYEENSFRGECAELRRKHFIPQGARCRLRPEVATPVRFERGNLLEAGPLLHQPKYHIIFCRNLLIYMTALARKRALETLDRCLEPDGLLFTGHAEAISSPNYRPVDHPLAFAYRRAPAAVRKSVRPAPAGPPIPPAAPLLPRRLRAAKPPPPRPRPLRVPAPAARTSAGCWGRVGSGGDRSCAELKKALHCRNCETFTAAARAVFDQPPPPGYRDELAGVLAAREAPRPEHETSILVFRVKGSWLALPSRGFKGVYGPQPVHAVPHRKGVLKGLVNIEGELHLHFDMAELLGLSGGAAAAPAAARVFPRLLVFRRDGQDWTFAADEVLRIASLDSAEVRPAAAPEGRAYAAGSFALDGKEVVLLDEELLAGSLRRGLR
ncbi:MAG: chemotaxis protein CheW [Elusimicrobia bacterium]|nr:chemotaxis protein CheW [Elusimicrobiota bacterium]